MLVILNRLLIKLEKSIQCNLTQKWAPQKWNRDGLLSLFAAPCPLAISEHPAGSLQGTTKKKCKTQMRGT